MTTLDQARAVAQRLRETYTAYNESSDEFIHRLQLERLDAANAIVALIAEVERLTKVDVEPVMYQYRWLNPAGGDAEPQSMLDWQEVKPRNAYMDSVEDRIAELEAYRYERKRVYEVRGLVPASALAALQQENERLKEEVQRHAALCKWYAEDNSTINAQLKTYQEREKTMGWNQS